VLQVLLVLAGVLVVLLSAMVWMLWVQSQHSHPVTQQQGLLRALGRL
jgi:hypothetical protein